MKTFNKLLFCLFLSFFSFSFSYCANNNFKILHVMSYHSPWSWTDEQFNGFKDGIGDLKVEYKVVQLDTKRDSREEAILLKVKEAQNIIEQWKPDLLYANDDNAQKYLTTKYVGTNLPIVFSAVNRDPSEYNFLGADNITGVMEYEHFVPTINLLRSIKKDIRKIAVIADADPTWRGVMIRMRANLKYIRDLEVVDWNILRTFDDYKNKIFEFQKKADAIAILGVFNFKDKNGNNVDYTEVLKWTAENSMIPDFTFWESRIHRGTLCAVSVSAYEQGLLAGQMARKILNDGISPKDIKIGSSQMGQPMINLNRARDLGLKIDVEILLNNKVIKDYIWDR